MVILPLLLYSAEQRLRETEVLLRLLESGLVDVGRRETLIHPAQERRVSNLPAEAYAFGHERLGTPEVPHAVGIDGEVLKSVYHQRRVPRLLGSPCKLAEIVTCLLIIAHGIEDRSENVLTFQQSLVITEIGIYRHHVHHLPERQIIFSCPVIKPGQAEPVVRIQAVRRQQGIQTVRDKPQSYRLREDEVPLMGFGKRNGLSRVLKNLGIGGRAIAGIGMTPFSHRLEPEHGDEHKKHDSSRAKRQKPQAPRGRMTPVVTRRPHI